VPNLQYRTPDDGHRRFPKHVEFYNRINWIVSASCWVFKKKFILLHFISATGKMRPVGRTRTLHLCNAIRYLISETRNENIRNSRNNFLSATKTNVTHIYVVLWTIKHTLHNQILIKVTRQLSIRNLESKMLAKCTY
jgi:hypothetical protein